MALGALDENESRWTDGLTTTAWLDKAGGGRLLEGSSGSLTGGKRHGQCILSQRYSLHHRRQSQHITSKSDPRAGNLGSSRKRHVGSIEGACCHDSTPRRVRWQQFAESNVGDLGRLFQLHGLGNSFDCLRGAESVLVHPGRSGRGDGRDRFDRGHRGECGQQSRGGPSFHAGAPCGFLTGRDLAAAGEPSIGAGPGPRSGAIASCGRTS